MEQPVNNDTLAEHLQRSIVTILLRLLAAIFMLDVVYGFLILGFLGLDNLHGWHLPYVYVLFVTNLLKYLVMTAVVISLFVDWAGRSYYLSGHHLIEHVGLINITETTHELSQVKSVVFNQTWLGRRFNYGTIRLTLAGTGGNQEVIIRDVNNPSRYRQHFDQHLQVQGWVR